jgi:ribosomal protein S18 acetylase RimI-like enzyme
MTRRYHSEFGAFAIDPVPGQPQLAHCHSFFVVPEGRGKGIGTQMKLKQMEQLEAELYDYATCTVDAANTAQKRVLEKTGWKRLAVFDNRRTGGKTELWGWEVGTDGESA